MIGNMMKRWNTRTLKPEDFGLIREVTDKDVAFTLTEMVGKGSTCEVYRARRGSILPYEFGIKICPLPPQQVQEPSASSESEGTGRRSSDTVEGVSSSTGEVKANLEDLQCEIKILRSLQKRGKKSVVHLFDCFQVNNAVWIVMEYMPVSLRTMLWLRQKEGKARLLVWDAAVYIQGIAKALIFLKSKRIVHRDLKPGNVMLSKVGDVKLCDFGISKKIPEGQNVLAVDDLRGSPAYMASELFMVGAKYDYNADMWAVGVMLHDLCFEGENLFHKYARRFKERYFDEYNKGFPSYIQESVGQKFLDIQQYRECTGHSLPESYWGTIRKYDQIRNFVQRAIVPLPSNGTEKHPVTRTPLESRLTVEEALAWAGEKLAGHNELYPRQTVIKHVKECMGLKKELDRKMQKLDELETSERESIEMHYYGDSSSTSL